MCVCGGGEGGGRDCNHKDGVGKGNGKQKYKITIMNHQRIHVHKL